MNTLDMALRKAIEPSEADIQNSIIEYLNKSGHFAWRNNTGAVSHIYKGKQRFFHFGKKGSSDIIGICKRDGKFIAIEVKSPGNKATESQNEFLVEIRARFGYATIATSLDDVINLGL